MGVRLTHEYVEHKIGIIHNGRIQLLSKYIASKELMDVKCNVCDHTWRVKWDNLSQGKGCPRCSGREDLSQCDVEEMVRLASDNKTIVIGEYIKKSEPFLCQCSSCGHQWQGRYHDLRKGKGCKICAGKQPLGWGKVFIRSSIKHYGKFTYPNQEKPYSNIRDYMSVICPTHGLFRIRIYSHMADGNGCRQCFLDTKTSLGIMGIEKYLNENNIGYKREQKFDGLRYKNPLLVDIVTDDNIWIEFDGKQHFIPVKNWGGDENLINIQIRDEIKNQYAIDHNIKLIRVRYDVEDIAAYLDEHL